MFQAIVHFNQTHVFAFDNVPTGSEIKNQLFEKEGIPAHFISLSCNGDVLDDECLVESDDSIIIRAVLVNGLCGGKGGFGAQLRALAKQKAHIKTVDFGACRDLSGRRLRHVNDEILLQKWKEAKDKGESFEADGETPTGIDLWYLSAPSWAEGVKVDKRKIFMKPRMKTSMCIDWKRAREHRPAPDGAPAHWGCPRGRRCEFAHGIEELRGEAQANMQNEKLEREQNERNKKRDDYMGVLYRSNKQEEELEDLVLTGLRAAKKAKMSAQDTEPAALDNTVEDFVDAISNSADADADAEDEVSMDYFTAVAGTVVVAKAAASASISSSSSSSRGSYYRNSTCPIISGTSAFATVVVDGSHIVPVQDTISSRSYYYEVELYSDGLMQLGWADQHFITALAGKSQSKGNSSGTENKAAAGDEEGTTEAQAEDGVGDCAHSWGYDGYRQQKWHSGEGTPYGPQTGAIWRTGDVVGCLLELTTQTSATATAGAGDVSQAAEATAKGSKKRKSTASTAQADSSAHTVTAKISYTVNGVSHGQAFEFSLNPSDLAGGLKFFPALSLENEESVLLNVGNAHFKHAPGNAVTSVWETITGVPLSESNSSVALAESSAPAAGEKAAVSSTHAPVLAGDTPAATAIAATVAIPAEPIDYAAITLEDAQYSDAASLEALGLVHLKQELERRGLKTGGTLAERAQRLFSVRGLAPAQYDSKLLAKKK